MMRKNNIIIGLGVILRLALLAVDDLWYDEAFTAMVCRLPWPRFWPAVLGDVHPPGWYIISRPFAAGPEWLLRLPAALFSVAALLLFAWWLARLELSAPARDMALLLMVLAPVQIRYAAEARMYAALELAALLIMAGVTLRRPWLLAAGVALAPWLAHLGWLYVGLGLALWAYRERGALPRPVAMALALAVPAGLVAIYQVFQMSDGGYWLHERSVGAWLYHAIFSQIFHSHTVPHWLAWHAGLLALGLAAISILAPRPSPLVIFAWLPGLLLLAVSQWRPLLLSRPLLGAAPAIYAAFGAAVGGTRRSTRIVLFLLITPLLLMSVVEQATGAARAPVEPLYQAAAGCSTIVHVEPSSWVLAQYYAPDQEHYLWDGWPPGLVTSGMSAQTERAVGVERMELDPAACWIVADHALVSDEQRAILQAATAGRRPDFTLVSNELLEVVLYR